jgi:uncharacterized circularly permuted ATP-grasp superfamily protein/uncharacterized alpha-E superfamily protein
MTVPALELDTDDGPERHPGPAGGVTAEAYDEMVTGDGRVRPHWRDFLGALATVHDGRLSDRIGRLRQQLADDGVLHSVYGDSRGRRQGWAVDPTPFLIEAQIWSALEAGIVQRAELLDRLLADLYGPQALLADGAVPPELVLTDPNYLRPCRAGAPASTLHIYAADVVRDGDGSWRVVSDRVQSPAGIGYLLANRRLSERILSDLLALLPVASLRPFLGQFEALVRSAAPPAASGRSPRVVVLTPGTDSADHVEHVYVAREIGALLLEGADLTVRDRVLYFKTLGGLERVDVLIRRIDGNDCDPLELSSASALGVPGLLQAWRAGNVTVMNGFGAGVAETPALAPLLPGLARRLLGRDLLLPNVETRWAGGEKPAGDAEIWTGAGADRGPHPWTQVARRRLVPSLTPRWTETGIEPTPTMLRLFAIGAAGQWTALPGGLARTMPTRDPFFTPLARSAGFRDVWVLGDRRTTPAAGPVAARRAQLQRSSGDLPSRAADDLFWLGRSVERIEGQLRLLRSAIRRLTETSPDPRVFAELRLLAACTEELGLIDEETAAAGADSLSLREGMMAIAGPEGPLQQQLVTIGRLVDGSRDRLSTDMWGTLERLVSHRELLTSSVAEGAAPGLLLSAIDRIVRDCAGVAGLAWENMTRGLAWRFLDAGRRIERAVVAAATVGRILAERGGEPGLRLMLELFDSAITYRLRYLAAVQFGPVLDLVLLDETNPRALAFQLRALGEHFAALPPEAGHSVRLDATLPPALARAISAIAEEDGDTGRAAAALAELLNTVHERLMMASDALTSAYFSHVRPTRALGAEAAK